MRAASAAFLKDLRKNVRRINNAVFVDVAANQVGDVRSFRFQLFMQLIERILRSAEIRREIGKEHFHRIIVAAIIR